MANKSRRLPITLKNDEEKKTAFEQYKILAESINKLQDTRENANNFWVGVNGLAISGVAYLRDTLSIPGQHKVFLLWTIIIFGVSLCLAWLSYLSRVKTSISVKNKVLVDLEKYFPVPIFANVSDHLQQKPNMSLLTLREMAVPCLFLSGYLFFVILLLFFTGEVVAPTKSLG